MKSIKLPPKKVDTKYLQATAAEKDFKAANIIRRRPDGIIIMDTYNNPFFPLKSVKFDTVKNEFFIIREELQKDYGITIDRLFLPWHFHLELQGTELIVRNTRPLMYKTLIPEYENYISIMITGNSNDDIYNKKLYKSLAHMVLNSLKFQPSWKLGDDEITLINIGENFNIDLLSKELR